MDIPYKEERINSSSMIRTFKHDVLIEELVWHRDRKSRSITVLEGDGWEFQFDNQLPVKLNQGDKFFVPAKTYHRIKRGVTDLIVRIEEFEES